MRAPTNFCVSALNPAFGCDSGDPLRNFVFGYLIAGKYDAESGNIEAADFRDRPAERTLQEFDDFVQKSFLIKI
jgi:hypothetical protein